MYLVKIHQRIYKSYSENTLTKFRARYRSVDYLLIDDIQFLIKEQFKKSIFNEIYEAQRQIFLTPDRPAGN